MQSKRLFWKKFLWNIVLAFTVLQFAHTAPAAELSGNYAWKPVKIGGGGFVVGMNTCASNSNAVICRTDVGNAYKWDSVNSVWKPLRVHNADGTGIQGPGPAYPGGYGEESAVFDPNNANTIYMAFPSPHTDNYPTTSGSVNVYKSTDSGANFTPSNLDTFNLSGDPNGNGGNPDDRNCGERIGVDPNNGNVVYYGSQGAGLYRSVNGASTFGSVNTGGAPASGNVIGVLFYKAGGVVSALGLTNVTKIVYAVVLDGDIYKSSDGGVTWAIISSVSDVSGHASLTTIDQNGIIYVPCVVGTTRGYYKYNGTWTFVAVPSAQNLQDVTVDPANASNIWCLAVNGATSHSADGGATWTDCGPTQAFANTLGWLPQTVGGGTWHSVGNMQYDSLGNLWLASGQEGMERYHPANNETGPPLWTITSSGIEELVSSAVVIPPGGGDSMVLACWDATGMVITNPDVFTAKQVTLQGEGISTSAGVAFCPNAPSYIAITSSNTYHNGTNFSGYSSDGGLTWTNYARPPQQLVGTNPNVYIDSQTGAIAVSRRGAWGLGADHIVTLPVYSFVPQWSKDGGATWHVSTGWPLVAGSDGMQPDGAQVSLLQGPWLHQAPLQADPFTPDKYYVKPRYDAANNNLYTSVDGGATWQSVTNSGLPNNTWHGQLQCNYLVQNDLWYVDGFGNGNASAHGIWHSTNGGTSFTQVAGVTDGVSVAIGKGSGVAGDALYSVYLYGRISGDTNWGVFRSTNAGASWDRVAYYPTGIYDEPTCMAASYDTFGKVVVGFAGNSIVYGSIYVPNSPPSTPANLTATAGNTQVTLAWAYSTGASTYNVYRGTAPGGESATAIATGLTSTSYVNTGLTNGTTYYYKVAAVNTFGPSLQSNEASAIPSPQPPSAPTGLAAEAGDAQVSLLWTASSGATSYNVYRGTLAGGESTTAVATGVPTTTYIDTGLVNGTAYFYTVKAVNAVSPSTPSNEASTKPSAANSQIAFATTAPTIDGAVDAVWSGAASYPMLNVTGTIPTGATNTGSWQALWDSTNLYVLVSIQDSTVLANSDSVEVYVDGSNGKSGAYTNADWQWVFVNGNSVVQEYSGGSSGGNTAGIMKADGGLAGGWRMEAKIPWSTIGVSQFANNVIGLDIAYNNYNVAGTRANKLFWFSTTDNDWTNPALFGTAKLMPGGSVPPVPTGLTATAGDTQVSLSWSASSGATSYNVLRSTVSGSGYASVTTGVTTTSYTNTGLTNGTAYYFVVSATNAGGTSANSAPATATPVAQAGNTHSGTWSCKAVLSGTPSWTQITQLANVTSNTNYVGSIWIKGTGAVSIVIYLGNWGTQAANLQCNATSTWQQFTTPVFNTGANTNMTFTVQDSGYTAGTLYIDDCFMGVSGGANTVLNPGFENGADSNWDLGAPFTIVQPGGAPAVPAAPTGLTATPGNAQASLSWTASTGATSYNALRSTVSGSGYASVASGIAATTYTNTGLTNGTAYYFVVSATNSGGTSPNSAQASATPVAAPAAPTGLTATAGNALVTLSWSASTGATSYNVQRSTVSGSGYSQVTNVATTSYTNTGLTNGTTYFFVVSALNTGGESANSAQASAAPIATPAAPVGLTATPGNAQVALAWTATSGATSYTVKRSTVSGSGYANVASPTVNNYTNTGLTNFTAYYFVVSATNAGGTSANSAQVSGTPVAITAAPTGLTATPGNTQVALTWAATTGAASYNIYRGTAAGGESTTAIATGIATTTYTNTGLANGTTYYYKIKAVNTAGTSAYSNEASAMAQVLAPTSLTATAGSTQVGLSWTASTGATSYSVFRGTTAGGESTTAIVTGIATTNFTNTGLTNGTTYYYKVKAVNATSTSAYSTEASAMPVAGNTHTGTWSCKAVVTGTPSWTQISQNVTVVANTNYTGSIWVKGTGAVSIVIYYGNWVSQAASVQCNATSTWQQFTTPVFNSGANTTMVFTVQDADYTAGTLYIDDTFMGVSGGANLLPNPGFESGNVNWGGGAAFSIVQNP